MFNYTRKSVTISAILITIIIFVSLNFILFINKNNNTNSQNEKNELVLTISKQLESDKLENQEKLENQDVEPSLQQGWEATVISKTENINQKEQQSWKIEIPAINLSAPILEGTTYTNMRKAVTHFKDTATWNGNTCLAAHNRGYKYDYFAQIKNLKIGDEIVYKTEKGVKKYKVETNKIIGETDWSYLQETQDNRITLITCEKEQPEYRRCVQAVEI